MQAIRWVGASAGCERAAHEAATTLPGDRFVDKPEALAVGPRAHVREVPVGLHDRAAQAHDDVGSSAAPREERATSEPSEHSDVHRVPVERREAIALHDRDAFGQAEARERRAGVHQRRRQDVDRDGASSEPA